MPEMKKSTVCEINIADRAFDFHEAWWCANYAIKSIFERKPKVDFLLDRENYLPQQYLSCYHEPGTLWKRYTVGRDDKSFVFKKHLK